MLCNLDVFVLVYAVASADRPSSFSPDIQYVMCGSHDGGVYVWNCRTEKLEKTLREHKYVIYANSNSSEFFLFEGYFFFRKFFCKLIRIFYKQKFYLKF